MACVPCLQRKIRKQEQQIKRLVAGLESIAGAEVDAHGPSPGLLMDRAQTTLDTYEHGKKGKKS